MTERKKASLPEEARKARRFPKGKAVLILLFFLIQTVALTLALTYTPTPQDRIDRYELLLSPNEDGSLDLEYRFVWTALDPNEALTWVEIGMPNKYFDFIPDAISPNIVSYETYTDGDYVSARLDLDRPYEAGETITFSFRVRQRELLCQSDDGYFYELVPSWFNATPVESYRFVFRTEKSPLSSNADTAEGDELIWEGEMPCGSYVLMRVDYAAAAFPPSAPTVAYEEFYDGDVTNSLKEDKIGVIILASLFTLGLLAAQIYLIDSVVSYHRGRGFLRGYGHHIHIYGRVNPRYEEEQQKHGSRGGRSGGGCACACACACAGGGRAGCSQKDTVAFPLKRPSKKGR